MVFKYELLSPWFQMKINVLMMTILFIGFGGMQRSSIWLILLIHVFLEAAGGNLCHGIYQKLKSVVPTLHPYTYYTRNIPLRLAYPYQRAAGQDYRTTRGNTLCMVGAARLSELLGRHEMRTNIR